MRRQVDKSGVVHIVDDDAAVRHSLERLLNSAGIATAAYSSALHFLEAIPGLAPGCILLDVWMPEVTGLELQLRLKNLGLVLPIIVMTAHGDVQSAVQAMKAGAVDFLEKPFDEDCLFRTVEEAIGRSAVIECHREAAQAIQRMAALSRRERQVLDAVVAGKPSKVIAYELGISIRTVEVHRARMLERLGTRRAADAIRIAVLAGTIG
jgi:two-component system response regulator FixJ